MLKQYITSNDKSLSANCDDNGTITVTDEYTKEIIIKLNLFNDKFSYLKRKWSAEVNLKFNNDNTILAISYGIGYVYLIDIINSYKLFEDVDYTNNSFKEIYIGAYYNEYTEFDFSPNGKYLAIRIRGDFDAQELDGPMALKEPVYFRTIFIIELSTYFMHYKYTFDEANIGKANIGVLSFSNDDYLMAIGVFGGNLKIIDLLHKKEIYSVNSLEWIPFATDVDDRKLVSFIDNNCFVFVNKEKQISLVCKNPFKWKQEKIIYENIKDDDTIIMDITYNKTKNTLSIETLNKTFKTNLDIINI